MILKLIQGTNSIVVNWGNKLGNVNAQAVRTCSGASTTKSLLVNVNCREYQNIAGSEIQMNLYPNPNSGLFKLEISNNQEEIEKIIITDISGRTVQTNKINSSNHQILLDYNLNLENGMYLIAIYSNKGITTKQITIIN